MCGIVGSVFAPHESRDWIITSTQSLAHRGPDDQGWVQFDQISLGMTRLAIVDIEGGKQPFFSRDKRYSLIFNGQIYNFKELRSALEKRGQKFISLSDTEVVLNGYIQYGERIVDYLEGMFAFAIWDGVEESLFIARDKFGEKPLAFSHLPNGGIIFASEIKALLAHEDVSREPDFESIQLMLNFGYIPSPRSAYKNIKKLPPGHYLKWKNNQIEIKKYWSPRTKISNHEDENSSVKELDSLLMESVSLRMNSDRGVGAWLSGGVDSSLVTYYMSQLQDGPVDTFSAGFKSKPFDESEFSTIVSKSLKTKHNLVIIDDDIERVMLGIGDQLDEPFADSSFVATYILSEFTQKKRVVVLGGDGGDEAFGGYERYRLMSLVGNPDQNGKAIQLLFTILSKFPTTLLPTRKLARAQQIISNPQDRISQYKSMMSWVSEVRIAQLLGEKFDSKASKWFDECLSELAIKDRRFEFSANLWDSMSYLPGDLLPKVDMASMAFGVEVRSPFLDSKIFNFGLSLPDHLRVTGSDSKILLKKLARMKLPSTIVDRPKRGFGIPREDWLHGQLRGHLNHVLSSSNSKFADMVNIGEVQASLKEFQNGKSNDTEIWALYMLGNWAARWL